MVFVSTVLALRPRRDPKHPWTIERLTVLFHPLARMWTTSGSGLRRYAV